MKSFLNLVSMKKLFDKITINPVLLILLVFCFVACTKDAYKSKTTEEDALIANLIHKLVANTHYNQLKIDDEFSKQAFKSLLGFTDPNKRFFLEKDVKKLKTHELLLDNYFSNANLEMFDEYFPLVSEREKKVSEMVLKLLESPITFKTVVDIQIEADSLNYCKSKKELKNRWKKSLAFMINDRLYQLEKKQLKDTSEVKKTMEELEVEAREHVSKKHKEWFKRLSRLEKNDRLANYFNAILAVYCPHTNYFPPKEKEDFDIGFSGKLEGIGATLSVKDGYIRVEKIVPGSASWKAGDLEAGDLILEVAQGEKAPVDVYDMRLDKAVRLIRGPKGTEVRLTIKKVSGDIEVISIVRDIVVIAETYAKSVLVKDSVGGELYGYISLASFYADFNNRNGRRCSKDVLKELRALKKDSVEGVILDLRNNGGGSLSDAIEMAGYFIAAGPIVQVDGVGEAPQVYKDVNPTVNFSKPLIVLVNHYSASASEIFAAAIQDYGRGMILGTNTFGKGTVQRFYPLSGVAKAYDLELGGQKIGEMKETIAKFFRINGGATQLRGVAPDVVLPDNYMFLDLGEKAYDFALEWKSIPKATYTEFTYPYVISELAKNQQARVDTTKYFKQTTIAAKFIKEGNDNSIYTSDYTVHKADKQKRDKESKEIEDGKKKVLDWSVDFHSTSKEVFLSDTISRDRMKAFAKTIKGDMYIREAIKALQTMK